MENLILDMIWHLMLAVGVLVMPGLLIRQFNGNNMIAIQMLNCSLRGSNSCCAAVKQNNSCWFLVIFDCSRKNDKSQSKKGTKQWSWIKRLGTWSGKNELGTWVFPDTSNRWAPIMEELAPHREKQWAPTWETKCGIKHCFLFQLGLCFLKRQHAA